MLRILDGKGQLVPIGVDGEICIGGAGLARGYWRSADLTAEKFVSAGDGARGDAPVLPEAIADLIGSVDGLPADLSARRKKHLEATGYDRKRPR